MSRPELLAEIHYARNCAKIQHLEGTTGWRNVAT